MTGKNMGKYMHENNSYLTVQKRLLASVESTLQLTPTISSIFPHHKYTCTHRLHCCLLSELHVSAYSLQDIIDITVLNKLFLQVNYESLY